MDLTQLNFPQQQAVLDTEGPCLVVAGPGAGKTRVLIYRVGHLMSTKKVAAHRIMVLTFTNKAAREMQKRVALLLKREEGPLPLQIGTFHSIFSRILRREATTLGFTPHFSIYDDQNSIALLKKIIKEYNLPIQHYIPKRLLQRIGAAKRAKLDAEAYEANDTWRQEDEYRQRPFVYLVYGAYQKRCQQANAMDFDDLLFHTHRLFTAYPTILQRYQNKYDYVLVDEFQDTDALQYDILCQLVAAHHNLCVIGDDAQSIYGFRGAAVTNMRQFQHDFPTMKHFMLQENYRSPQHIVAVANSLMRPSDQIPKKLFTNNPKGELVRVFPMFNDLEEADFVVDQINAICRSKQQRYDDFAILYRNNTQSRVLEEALNKHHIPYQVIGNISFYQRQEIKDLLAYLTLLVNPHNEEALWRVINRPKRNVGPVTLQKARDYAQQHSMDLWDALKHAAKYLKGQVLSRIQSFQTLITHYQEQLSANSVFEIATGIAHGSGLMRLYKAEQTATDTGDDSKYDHLLRLLDSIRLLEDQNKGNTLSHFLQDIALVSPEEGATRPSVKLMTIHKAKGLEFPYVYLVGAEEKILSFDRRPQEQDEQRRVFFVGITRAQKQLTITYTENRYVHGRLEKTFPSRFLKDLDAQHTLTMKIPTPHITKNVVKLDEQATQQPLSQSEHKKPLADYSIFVPGVFVQHPSFGRGTILSLEGEGLAKRIQVNFLQSGVKTLVLQKSHLEPL